MVMHTCLLYRYSATRHLLLVAAILLFSCGIAGAQEMPPRPVSLSYVQPLAFGAFSIASGGGTVSIYTSGIRTATGGLVLMGMGYPFYPAIFNMEGNLGTVVHPMLGANTTLTGTNGGTLLLQLDLTDPADPIIINVQPPGQIPVKISGTLYVGPYSSNPAGFYTGTFSIMFIQE